MSRQFAWTMSDGHTLWRLEDSTVDEHDPERCAKCQGIDVPEYEPSTTAGRRLWAFLRDRWPEAGLITPHDILDIERRAAAAAERRVWALREIALEMESAAPVDLMPMVPAVREFWEGRIAALLAATPTPEAEATAAIEAEARTLGAEYLECQRLLIAAHEETGRAQERVRAALTDENEIAHGEAVRGGNVLDARSHERIGRCAYCGEAWPCRTQSGIDRLLAALAATPTPEPTPDPEPDVREFWEGRIAAILPPADTEDV